jgi:chromosomal replication initiator protein
VKEKIDKLFQNKIDKHCYENYISQLNFKKLSNDNKILTFEVPNRYLSGFIKTKFINELKTILKNNLTFQDIEKIVINVSGEKNKTNQKKLYQNEEKKENISFNKSFTFDNFVVGPSNIEAYTICKNIVQKNKTQYNPVFIYSDTGLGKTHLLQSVGNCLLKDKKNVLYLSAENFMNDYTDSIKSDTMPKFRDKYRKCDILLLDDVAFLTNKPSTQDEFFNTFNALHSSGKQIIMTSDRLPSKIRNLVDRLRTRFEWGLIIDIKPPQLKTKINIIKKKSELNDIILNDEIIQYIALNIDSSIREIESILVRINASVNLLNQDISLNLVKELLKNQITEKNKFITIIDIINTITKELNIKTQDLKSTKRTAKIVKARRIVIYLARKLTHNSMPEIAKHLRMKNQSSISKNIKKTEQLIDQDKEFEQLIKNIKKRIKFAKSENLDKI